MCDTNDTTGGCCSTTLSIGRPGEHGLPAAKTAEAQFAPPAAGAVSQAAPAGRTAPAGHGVTTAFGVEGMTCSHCVASVTEEVGRLEGVTGVRVDLVSGGVSTVTVESATMLDARAVAEAVDEAGYALAPAAS
ncbi:copper chaperone CopZ [Agromyces terreus]|uniref:Copper chaperone CopZ n=1 Tax=Agromyces terreus TaxID=424795 RepID=A0A9X2H092_9MICO|nr:heavy-metal-associated domain-containing protein [Agromyces terreus]MCP2370415.1 copper chaperone CopZ [Agromyces terreus]